MHTAEQLSVIKKMKDSFGMTKQRCHNPNCRDYPYYGGRGIKVCQRWRDSFENFLLDMGIRPDGMTLERLDNDGDYSPENCVWAPRSAQSANTRYAKQITWQGETHCVAEWERLKGFTPGTLKARLGTLGYSLEDAFNKPVVSGLALPSTASNHKRGVDRLFKSEDIETIRVSSDSPAKLAEFYGVSRSTIYQVINRTGAYSDC